MREGPREAHGALARAGHEGPRIDRLGDGGPGTRNHSPTLPHRAPPSLASEKAESDSHVLLGRRRRGFLNILQRKAEPPPLFQKRWRRGRGGEGSVEIETRRRQMYLTCFVIVSAW